jgi:hypothetical protein
VLPELGHHLQDFVLNQNAGCRTEQWVFNQHCSYRKRDNQEAEGDLGF